MIRHIPSEQNPLLVGRQAAEFAREKAFEREASDERSLVAIADWRQRARQLLDEGQSLFGGDELSCAMLDAVKAERAKDAYMASTDAMKENDFFLRSLTTFEIAVICLKRAITSYMPLALALALLMEIFGFPFSISVAASCVFAFTMTAKKFIGMRKLQADN